MVLSRSVWRNADVTGHTESLRARLRPWSEPFRASRPADPPFPWVAMGLALAVVATAFVTGTFVRGISDHSGSTGGFGWPSMLAGRWWTLGSSFLLSRNWFMAATMPLALLAAVVPYERRAGHGRALVVTVLGHVTGSVIVALASGALGWTGRPVFVRAAQNIDYGGSMAIAAVLGALASRVESRRWRVLAFVGVVLALALHHQMADWGHMVALPFGYFADRVRKPNWSRVGVVAIAGATAGLVAYGPLAVNETVQLIRFNGAAADASPTPRSDVARGTLQTLTYDARYLQGRPEVVQVYLPAGGVDGPPLPVVVFLHGIPGSGSDWLAGGGIAHLLDTEIATHRLPPLVAVFPNADGFHHPNAGWRDAPPQSQFSSLRRDLLPTMARRFHVALTRGSVAVFGVGRGADGALALGRVDARVGYVIAIHPRAAVGPAPLTGPLRYVYDPPRTRADHHPNEISTAQRWAHWRAVLPGALDWLGASTFGRVDAGASRSAP